MMDAKEIIRKELKKLPPWRRQIALMRWGDDWMRVSEIATVLECGQHSVREVCGGIVETLLQRLCVAEDAI